MVLLLAAAIASATHAPATLPGAAASAQATATIRVLRAVRIRFPDLPDQASPRAREAVLRAHDGSLHPARIVEFE